MDQERPRGRGERLTRAEDFQAVFRTGHRHATTIATVYIGPRAWGVRLGIPAGRRLGSAVLRNRLRRRVREAFGRLRARIIGGADVVIVPKKAAERVPFSDLVEVVEQALQRAGLIAPAEETGAANLRSLEEAP